MASRPRSRAILPAAESAKSLVAILLIALASADVDDSLRELHPALFALCTAIKDALHDGVAPRTSHAVRAALDATRELYASSVAGAIGARALRSPAVQTGALTASALAPSARRAARSTSGAGATDVAAGSVPTGAPALTSPPAEARGGVKAYVVWLRDVRRTAAGRALSASNIKARWATVPPKERAVFAARAASEVKRKRAEERAARTATLAATPAQAAPAAPAVATFLGGATAALTAAPTPGVANALLGMRRTRRERV